MVAHVVVQWRLKNEKKKNTNLILNFWIPFDLKDSIDLFALE